MPQVSTQGMIQSVAGAKIYDLAQPLDSRIPVSPNHPGFRMALMRRHGDLVREDGGSAASELMTLGGHSGTHVDALCHVSHRGKLHGDHDANEAQRGGRFLVHGVETVPLVLCRGVMLDIPGLFGVEVLEPGTAISREHLRSAAEKQKLEIRKGDAVLIRSGWTKYWSDATKFVGLADGVPGPDQAAAQWLAERQIRITGAETIAYEHIPPQRGHALLPAHRVLLVENGIFIVESMDLSELASDQVWEFLFVLTPIKVMGATGVPVRPVAITL